MFIYGHFLCILWSIWINILIKKKFISISAGQWLMIKLLMINTFLCT